jgi:TolA-binding protein
MPRVRWFILLFCFLLAGRGPLPAAPTAENRAFDAAANAFTGAFYDRAEAEFSDFTQKFPQSTRLPEAILFQAKARLEQTNYAGAIELLSSHMDSAGIQTDQYLFWLAESWMRKGEYKTALATFDKLIKDFPVSPRRLEAVLREATARSRLSQWPEVIELLRRPDGVFQNAARTNAGDDLVVRGYLLLSEAQLTQKDFPAAEKTLQPLGKLLLNPARSWERQYLICRIQFAEGLPELALQSSSNLVSLARQSAQRSLEAESVGFRARVLESLGRPEEAIAAYTNNLVAGVPPERQRQALLKIAGLSLMQNKIAEAARTMEDFLAKHPGAPSADLAWLTLGEMRLRQQVAGMNANGLSNSATNTFPGTNYLPQAVSALETFARKFPHSSLFGKCQLDLGWCWWLSNKLPESQKAFQLAAQQLPISSDQAAAWFKLGDVKFLQSDFKGAITDYNSIIEKFASLPEAQTNLFESALYQTVRAGLAAGDLPSVTNALGKLLSWYPNGFHSDRAVLLTGQQVSREGNPEQARAMFAEFLKAASEAPLAPEVKLAIARTYEQENMWEKAIEAYNGWLTAYTNHPARPRAEYSRGWAYFQAGDETNALTCFTNFVALFPTNEFAPRAQWWVADYYFQRGDSLGLQNAEVNYQLLYKNWPGSEFTYQAQMMAGRVALARQGWDSARDYFMKLWNDTNCPDQNLRLEAFFALGDTYMGRDSTNKLADYEEAIAVFTTICDRFPTNRLAVPAWGERASCLLQWGQLSHQYDPATNAFLQVIDSPMADATARSIAKVGLGVVLEKLAELQQAPEEKAALLKAALNHYLDVFYDYMLRENEQPDRFWSRKAGLEAGRVAEALQQWAQAIGVYQRLQNLVPQMQASLEKRMLRCQENLDRAKN